MARASDASFREGLRSPASSPWLQRLGPTQGCEDWRAWVPRAGRWWPAAHPNSHPLGRHPIFGGLISWWGMWHSRHPVRDPSTELGGGWGAWFSPTWGL